MRLESLKLDHRCRAAMINAIVNHELRHVVFFPGPAAWQIVSALRRGWVEPSGWRPLW